MCGQGIDQGDELAMNTIRLLCTLVQADIVGIDPEPAHCRCSRRWAMEAAAAGFGVSRGIATRNEEIRADVT